MRTRHRISAIVVFSIAVGQSSFFVAPAAVDPGAIVDRFQAAYRAGSVPEMLAIYSPDATFEDVNQRHRFQGTDQLQVMLSGIVAMHVSLGLEEERRVVSGDTVVVEYAYKGQINGAALGASVGKEGCPDLEYSLPATSWFRVENGHIVNQRDFIDWATFLALREELLAAGTDAGSELGNEN